MEFSNNSLTCISLKCKKVTILSNEKNDSYSFETCLDGHIQAFTYFLFLFLFLFIKVIHMHMRSNTLKSYHILSSLLSIPVKVVIVVVIIALLIIIVIIMATMVFANIIVIIIICMIFIIDTYLETFFI